MDFKQRVIPTFGKKGKKETVAQKVEKLETQVSNLTKVQLQDQLIHDSGIGTTISSAGSIFGLVAIPQDNRNGTTISVRAIEMRLSFVVASVDGTNFMRMMVLYDKQSNATPVTVADIIKDSGAGNFLSMKNYENRKRFRVLKDKVYRLDTSGPNTLYTHWYKSFKSPLSVIYSEGDATTVIKNNIILLLVSDSTTIAHPAAAGTIRIKYNE